MATAVLTPSNTTICMFHTHDDAMDFIHNDYCDDNVIIAHVDDDVATQWIMDCPNSHCEYIYY